MQNATIKAQVSNGKKISSRKQQGGWGLLETLIVIAVAGLAIGAVVARGNNATEKEKINQDMQSLQVLGQNLAQSFATKPDTAAVTVAYAIAYQAAPQDMINGAALRNKVGGSIAVAPATLNTANDAIQITSNNYDQQGCLSLASKAAATFRTVTVNTTVVKAATAPAVTEATLQGACTNTTANTIDLVIAKG